MRSNCYLLRFSWVSTMMRVLGTLWIRLTLTFSLLVWETKPLRRNLWKPGCKILLELGTNLRVTVLPLHGVQLGHICSLILCQVTMPGVLGKPLLISVWENAISQIYIDDFRLFLVCCTDVQESEARFLFENNMADWLASYVLPYNCPNLRETMLCAERIGGVQQIH